MSDHVLIVDHKRHYAAHHHATIQIIHHDHCAFKRSEIAGNVNLTSNKSVYTKKNILGEFKTFWKFEKKKKKKVLEFQTKI